MPVLILTSRGEEADKVHGLRLGADDYVTKPFGLAELLARVEALLRRSGSGAPLAPVSESFSFGDVHVDAGAHVVTKGGEEVSLTPREFELLLALLRRPRMALSRAVLLKHVWGQAADIMTRTVDIHIGELRRKLEDAPADPRYIVTVWKVGYRFDP